MKTHLNKGGQVTIAIFLIILVLFSGSILAIFPGWYWDFVGKIAGLLAPNVLIFGWISKQILTWMLGVFVFPMVIFVVMLNVIMKAI